MAPYQQRVVEEAQQLGERIDKLQTFLGSLQYMQLDAAEQRRLAYQASHMADYAMVLADRINAWPKDGGT